MQWRNPGVVGFACCAILLAGCSRSYNGERLFWKAQQLNAPIVKDLKATTPEQFAKATHAFERVIKEAAGTVWAARAQVAVGSLYSMQKQYGKAREAFALVLQNYNQYQDMCLGARFATARTYEAEKRWEEAVKVYTDIADYHRWTTVGLEAPLYIARTYEQRKQSEEARRAYERAVRRYTNLIPDAPTPELAVQVKGFLILAYQRLGDWEHAVQTLEDLVSTPAGTNRPTVLFSLGSIYQSKLLSPKKAQSAYSTLIQEFPDNPFSKVAKAQLEKMGLPVLTAVNASSATPVVPSATPPVTPVAR